MQFFLFDLALPLVALLGYRAVVVVVRHRAPVPASLEGRMTPRLRASGKRNEEITRPRKRVVVKPVTTSPNLPERAPRGEPARAAPHRLINFW